MKFNVSAELSYKSSVHDYMMIEAVDKEDAQSKMAEYLKERIPAGSQDVEMVYMKVLGIE